MKKGDPRAGLGGYYGTMPLDALVLYGYVRPRVRSFGGTRAGLELETSPRAASLLTLGLLPWYLGKYHDPRAELSDHGTCHGTTVLPAPRAGT